MNSNSLPHESTSIRKEAEQVRHAAILKAAMEVFSDRGFYEAEVDEIAARAGVGKGTVFRHFGSKRELFLATVDWGMVILGDRIRDAIQDVEGSRNRIGIALRVYLRFFAKHGNFYRVLMQEKNNFRDDMEQRCRRKYFFDVIPLETAIRKGIENGEFHEIEPHSCAVALFGMSNALIHNWILSGMPGPLEDQATVIETIFFEGMLLNRETGEACAGSKDKCSTIGESAQDD